MLNTFQTGSKIVCDILRFLWMLFLVLSVLPPSAEAAPRAALESLLSQARVVMKPVKEPVGAWEIDIHARQLDLSDFWSGFGPGFRIPSAFQKLDALSIIGIVPVPVTALLSPQVWKPGMSLVLKKVILQLGHLHCQGAGSILCTADGYWEGAFKITSKGARPFLEMLVQEKTLPPVTVLGLHVLIGLLESQSYEGHKPGDQMSHTKKKRDPVQLDLLFRDKMIWVNGVPVAPQQRLGPVKPVLQENGKK